MNINSIISAAAATASKQQQQHIIQEIVVTPTSNLLQKLPYTRTLFNDCYFTEK